MTDLSIPLLHGIVEGTIRAGRVKISPLVDVDVSVLENPDRTVDFFSEARIRFSHRVSEYQISRDASYRNRIAKQAHSAIMRHIYGKAQSDLRDIQEDLWRGDLDNQAIAQKVGELIKSMGGAA